MSQFSFLRSELTPYNVRVVSLLPSLTETDMVREFRWFRGVQPAKPEDVAQALVRGLRRRQAEILVGWQSHAAVWTQRMSPWLVDRIINLTHPLRRNHRSPARSMRS